MYKMNMEVSMQFVDIPLIIAIVPSIFLLLVTTMKKRTCTSRVYLVVADHLIDQLQQLLLFWLSWYENALMLLIDSDFLVNNFHCLKGCQKSMQIEHKWVPRGPTVCEKPGIYTGYKI